MTRRLLSLSMLVAAFALCATNRVVAQSLNGRTRIKIGATTAVAIAHVGVERSLQREGRTFQWDVMVSPWQSVDGYPLTFASGVAEWRFYKDAEAKGWYAALSTGAVAFRLQRTDYRDTTLYQEGAGLLFGGSVGRVWQLRSGWTIDTYVGGGTIQSLYKGYDRATGRRYDGAELWNVSGELYPFRTGLMVGLPWRRPE